LKEIIVTETKPLLFTPSARDRILVALNWNERSDKVTIKDKIRGTNQQHDLDIACFVFNESGEYIDFVGAMAQDAMDSTGCIYHSGDDSTGEGISDDETISVELGGLPFDTTDLFFVVEVMSDHSFSEVSNPSIRIADGMTDKNLHESHINTGDASKKAFLAARISRNDRSPTGWDLHIIEEYPDLSQVSDWGSYLSRYL
jgi:stress response protein SCP2